MIHSMFISTRGAADFDVDGEFAFGESRPPLVLFSPNFTLFRVPPLTEFRGEDEVFRIDRVGDERLSWLADICFAWFFFNTSLRLTVPLGVPVDSTLVDRDFSSFFVASSALFDLVAELEALPFRLVLVDRLRNPSRFSSRIRYFFISLSTWSLNSESCFSSRPVIVVGIDLIKTFF